MNVKESKRLQPVKDALDENDEKKLLKYVKQKTVKRLLNNTQLPGVDTLALNYASQKGKANLVKILLEHGCDSSQRDRNGWNCLHSACCSSSDAVFKLIMSEGKISGIKSESSEDLLTSSGNGSGLGKELLGFNVRTNDGSTPLHFFARFFVLSPQRSFLLDFLIEGGADVDAQNTWGETPLHKAVLQRNSIVVSRLLEAGADPNKITKGGDTPLHISILAACMKSDEDSQSKAMSMIEDLIRYNADISIQNNKRLTAIDIAKEKKKENIVKILKQAEVVVNWLDSLGLKKLIGHFRKHQLTVDLIPKLNKQMMNQLGISEVGLQIKLEEAVKTFDPVFWFKEPPAHSAIVSGNSESSGSESGITRERAGSDIAPSKQQIDSGSSDEETTGSRKRNQTTLSSTDLRHQESKIMQIDRPAAGAHKRALSHDEKKISASADHLNSIKKDDFDEKKKSNEDFAADVRGVLGSTKRRRKKWEIEPTSVEIGKQLGEGGAGVVYKGKWCGIPVAVKKLHKRSMRDDQIETFVGEIGLMRKLRHPNICQFLGASLEKGDMFILLEFAERGNLHECINADKPTWGLRLRFARDIARGMYYLHANNPPILHRDLKSMNVLIDENYRAKVSDFGISREIVGTGGPFSGQASGKNQKNPTGTVNWACPEEQQTEKSDIYSFGIVLWEILTGEFPFMNYNIGQLIINVHTKGERPKIPEKSDSQYVNLMKKAWAGEPEDRPSFEVILKTLEKLVESNGSLTIRG